jgi:putative membrane protein
MLLDRLPLLHFDGEYPEGLWHSDWQVEPQILLTGFLLIAGYLALIGPISERFPGHEQRTVSSRQVWCFISGALIMTLIMGPPFHDWGDYYLVSVHMLQHLVLMLVVAPLLLKGIPAWFFNPITRRPRLDRIGRFVTQPVVSFVIGNAIMVLWHLPALYDAALEEPALHAMQHNAFVISAFFTWWPIIAPNPNWHKASPIVASLLLFAETLPGGIVGAILTFAEPGVYSFYNTAPRLWGISLADDQQLAGLMMWAGVPVVYLSVLSVIFLRWASREEAKERGAPPATRVASGPDTASIS